VSFDLAIASAMNSIRAGDAAASSFNWGAGLIMPRVRQKVVGLDVYNNANSARSKMWPIAAPP
jgi:hypothetical protein